MHTHRSPPEPHAQPRLAPALPLVRGALALLFTLVLAAIFSPPSLAGDVLRRGLGPEPDSADVHQAQGLAAVNLLRDLREGLVTFDVAGALVPGAASRWQALDEGRTWRFEIREDARWSNGDPVLASDFVRGLSLALDPSNAAPMASLLAPIENASRRLSGDESPGALGVEALEPRVLEILLERAVPWFLEILAHPVSFPIHERAGPVIAQEVNGAYRLGEWTPNAVIRLEKNPHFHAAAEVAVQVVEYYPIEQPDAELSRYRAGELHITETIPPGRHDWLAANFGDDLRIHPYLGSFWLNINVRHAELGRSAKLRRALALAIDRDILTRVVIGAGEVPAFGVVPPGLEGYEPARMAEATSTQEEREALARQLFRASGADESGTLRLQLRYNTSSVHRRMAVAVSAMWKQVLGIDTELFNEEWKVFVNNRRLGVVTEVFRGGWIADYADPATFLDLFRGGSEMNFTFWDNPDYNALIAEAENSVGADRMTRLRQAEALLLQEMPAIPLYYYVSRHLVNPGVNGFVDNVRDIHLSRYLSLEQP